MAITVDWMAAEHTDADGNLNPHEVERREVQARHRQANQVRRTGDSHNCEEMVAGLRSEMAAQLAELRAQMAQAQAAPGLVGTAVEEEEQAQPLVLGRVLDLD